MPDKTYKMVEIVGVSDDSIQQAVRNALAKASRTLRNLDWFEVTAIRGLVRNNRDPQFQVQLKVGFRLLERDLLASLDEPTANPTSTERAERRKEEKRAGKRDKKNKGRKK
ncbi:MAG TPA: dodecin [Candidatus Binatia bacterium]